MLKKVLTQENVDIASEMDIPYGNTQVRMAIIQVLQTLYLKTMWHLNSTTLAYTSHW